MNTDLEINYIELPTRDIPATKTFFSAVFGWNFKDFGPDYTANSGKNIGCGFYQSSLCSTTQSGAALPVIYTVRLDDILEKVKKAGGDIVKPVFSFPGGRRFHFLEPGGNEFAVWSDK